MDPLVLRLLLSVKQQELVTLRQLQALITVVTCIGDVVHQLQRERGLSNLVMYTPQPVLTQQLNAQATAVDIVLDEAFALIAQLLSSGLLQTARLQSALACALHHSQGLAQVRLAVAQCQAREQVSEAPCAQYSLLIRHWLDVVIEAAGLSVSPQVSTLMLSLIYLLQAKEFAGQERAWGVVAFSGKAKGAELTERLQVLAQSQQDALQALWSGLSTEICQAHQPDFCNDSDPQYLQLKQLMLGLCRHQQGSPALAELWFQCASRRIDLLHALLEPLKAALEQQLNWSKQDDARQQHQLKLQADSATRTPDSLAGLWPAGIRYAEQAPLFQLLREQSQHIGHIEHELEQARQAVQELKIVQRAKLMLIAQHKISEQQAHHQLQKLAMDRQQSLAEVATLLVKTVQSLEATAKKSAKSS